MKKNKLKKYQLFFDDFCPLCISTIKFLKKYVKPKNVNYRPISLSKLSQDEKNKALKDMLLSSEEGEIYWGYNTYIKIFDLSASKISLLFKFCSLIMQSPVIRKIGKITYSKISKNRMRCSNSCKTK